MELEKNNIEYRPDRGVYWFQVPNFGSMKFSYDNMVVNEYGNRWFLPENIDGQNQEDISGSIILFSSPNKIVDVFLIQKIEDNRICLSPLLFTILWKDLLLVPPIPKYYHSPERNHPVKLDHGSEIKIRIKETDLSLNDSNVIK